MTTISEFLVKIGVRVEAADAAQKRVEAVKQETKELGEEAKKAGGIVKGAFSGMGDAANTLFEKMGGLKGVLLVTATAVVGLAKATFDFANDQSAAIDATNKLSTSLGLNVEELQRLQFAFGQSGVNAEKGRAAILKLNQAMLILKQDGTGPAIDAFGELGLKLGDLDKLSTTDKLGLIGERLQDIGSDAERSATAARIFGEEAGPALASLLAEGREGLQRLGDAAGDVLTQEDADRASEFQDRLGEVRQEVSQLYNRIAVELIPIVRDIVVGFKDWIRENRAFIAQGLANVLREIGAAFKMVADEVRTLQRLMAPLNESMDKFGGAAGVAAGALDIMRGALRRIVSPLRSVGDDLAGLIGWMERIGAVAPATAQQLALLIGVVSGKTDDQLKSAIDQVRKLAESNTSVQSRLTMGGASTGVFTGVDKAIGWDIDAGQFRPVSGGGGGSKPKDKKKPEVPLPTVDEIISGILSGRGDVLADRIKGLSVPGSTAEAKPQVAIDFFHVEVAAGAITVVSENPMQSGRQVLDALGSEFMKAATVLKSGPKR